MKKFKKILVGALAVFAVVAYPVVSKGKSDTKDVLVFNETNVVSLSGEINSESVAATAMALRSLDTKISFGKPKPIYLFVSSPGGSIQDGFELAEVAKGLTRPVETVTSFGASMAFQIVQSLGERHMLKNGVLMSHRAAGGFEGSFGGQYPSQVDSRYGFWMQRVKELDEQTVSRTHGKQTLQSYQEFYKNEGWLTGQQAVAQGYADDIVIARCDKTLTGNSEHHTTFMGIPITYETSKCPLITALLNIHLGDKFKDDSANRTLTEEVKNKFIESFDFEKMIH